MAGDIVLEDVPRFVKRIGDNVTEGSNNTIIILGRDRAANGPASRDSGLGKDPGSGTIHLIAGRKAQDPDLKSDDSFLYLSRKTKADSNLNISEEIKSDDKPSAILKSDVLRLVGRKDIKICANDDDKHFISMDRAKIKTKFNDHFISVDDGEIKLSHSNNSIITANSSKVTAFAKNTGVTINGMSDITTIHAKALKSQNGWSKPWEDLLTAIVTLLLKHTHLTVVGPALPVIAGLGPGDTEGPMFVQTKLTPWLTSLH